LIRSSTEIGPAIKARIAEKGYFLFRANEEQTGGMECPIPKPRSRSRDRCEGEMMPARPSHIPHNLERTTLQKMSTIQGLSSEQLHPAGKQTIAGMLAKGWIEMRSDGRGGTGYSITPAGEAALKTKIPDQPQRR
jgi:hypothetical protein